MALTALENEPLAYEAESDDKVRSPNVDALASLAQCVCPCSHFNRAGLMGTTNDHQARPWKSRRSFSWYPSVPL